MTGLRTSLKPKKSYLAVSNNIPQIDERYDCCVLEKGVMIRANTSPVRGIRKLSDDVFVVVTKNSYYVTKILYLPEDNVYFAKIFNMPEIGKELICEKIQFKNEGNYKAALWRTTQVRACHYVKGLYNIETKNSLYVCIPEF